MLVELQPFIGLLSPHLKGFGTYSDYNKAHSPYHGPVSALHIQVYQNLFLQMQMALPSWHLAPKDILCTFCMLDTREADVNKIWHRLIEMIFLFCFRVVSLLVTSAILFLPWSLTIFSSLLYGYPLVRNNLRKRLFLPYSWDICQGKGVEGKWALRPPPGAGS